MGQVRFDISPELLHQVLQMPDDVEIVGVQMHHKHGVPWVELTVMGDGLPERPEGQPAIEVTPVGTSIHDETDLRPALRVEWQWNLPDATS
jgi:hypothetical protein